MIRLSRLENEALLEHARDARHELAATLGTAAYSDRLYNALSKLISNVEHRMYLDEAAELMFGGEEYADKRGKGCPIECPECGSTPPPEQPGS